MRRVTILRLDRGWSKSKLASEAGMSASTVGQIENGNLVPYASQRAKLARALGFKGSPDDLFVELHEEAQT
jgi:transcriptional regulator with XRE-family HTH domain